MADTVSSFLPPSVPPTITLFGGGSPYLNATEFFRRYPDDVMKETMCTEAVLRFQPSNAQFMQILGPAGYVMVAGATVALVLLLALFCETVIRVHRVLQAEHKFPVSVILSVYPVLGLCSFLGILFPKSNAMMDAASQLWFALCMLQFFKLTLLYFGGESAFVETLGSRVLPWRGPPCCCWPCCWPIWPKTSVSKSQVRFLRILVLQHPFVQSIMTIIGLSLWIEGYYTAGDFSPDNAYVYIFTISTVSFLFGLWAFIVGFKASIPELRRFNYGRKILTFQLCLVFLRFQALVFGVILLPSGAIPCVPPISPSVYANTILCCLLLGQLVILSVLARHFYTLPTPAAPLCEKGAKATAGESSLLQSSDEEMGDVAPQLTSSNNNKNEKHMLEEVQQQTNG